jgi:hypothetical protein
MMAEWTLEEAWLYPFVKMICAGIVDAALVPGERTNAVAVSVEPWLRRHSLSPVVADIDKALHQRFVVVAVVALSEQIHVMTDGFASTDDLPARPLLLSVSQNDCSCQKVCLTTFR